MAVPTDREHRNNSKGTLRYWGCIVLGLSCAWGLTGCWDMLGITSESPAIERPKEELQVISVQTARRQTSWVFLGMPTGTGTVSVTVGKGVLADKTTTAPATQTSGVELGTNSWQVYGQESRVKVQSGPGVEQLLGTAQATRDDGSVLHLGVRNNSSEAVINLAGGKDCTGGIWLEMPINALQPAGTYLVPVEIQNEFKGSTTPPGKEGLNRRKLQLKITVADLVLPQEPAISAIATVTTDELQAIFPATFGAIQAKYLDRGESDHAGAVAQLDKLVKSAATHGIAFYVEDLGPGLHVNSVGALEMDWSAYDRTVGPYLDGTGMPNGVGLTTWVVPLPPRRIADSPAQLKLYWQACLEHAARKNWGVTPVLGHPAWNTPLIGQSDISVKLAQQGWEAQQTVASGNNTAVWAHTPWIKGVTENTNKETGQVWLMDDSDARIPPVGGLGSVASVRVWPWMCQARGVKGLWWRHALVAEEGGQESLENKKDSVPLWTVKTEAGEVVLDPTVRLVWLKQGLNDSAHMELLRRRAPGQVTGELLSAVVGRTGIIGGTGAQKQAGYLYAGWLDEGRIWGQLPVIVDKLISVHTPGAEASGDLMNDADYLAARTLMAQAHKPLSRVEGWRFGVEGMRKASVVNAEATIKVENPLMSEARVRWEWSIMGLRGESMGDWDLLGPPLVQDLGAFATATTTLQLNGHDDSLGVGEVVALQPLRIREMIGGAVMEMPVKLPIYRMRATGENVTINGKLESWPGDIGPMGGGAMTIELQYANKPDLLMGKSRKIDNPAIGHWTYDANWLYGLIEVPQSEVDEQRTSEWPQVVWSGGTRWWGTDGMQIQIAAGGESLHLRDGVKVYGIGVKPSGTVLTRMATVAGGKVKGGVWEDGPTGLKYAVVRTHEGYRVEVAIPRKWFAGKEYDKDKDLPVWRVNVLRHQNATHTSSSWAGPVVDDDDLQAMGLLLGSR